MYPYISRGALTCSLTGWHPGRSVGRATGADGLEPPKDSLLFGPTCNPSFDGTLHDPEQIVGQPQILTDFSEPFELAGLFGAADEGAFASAEVTIGDDTAAHESEMVADDTVTPLRLPLKRLHSLYHSGSSGGRSRCVR